MEEKFKLTVIANLKISPYQQSIVEVLMKNKGLSRGGVFRLAVMMMAERDGILDPLRVP
jgi:hypothetical protein